MSPALDALTEDHAAVYDRQLRVWGVEVQRRLMEAKVLIIGLGGLAAEVAKNIVLAGVGTVALMDDAPATSAAPGNFLVEPAAAEAGKSVAEACAATLQAMNPLMSVRVEPGGPHSVAALLTGGEEGASEAEALRALLSRYDLVVACGGGGSGGLPLRQLAALDAACRDLGRQLFAGEVRGASSFVFVDLGEQHAYTVKGEPGEKVVKYGSFRDAMAGDLGKVNKRTHPLYFVLRACWEFEQAHSRPAGHSDVAAVQALAERLIAAAGKAAQALQLPEGLLESFALDGATAAAAAATGSGAEGTGAGSGSAPGVGELAPVCAVVGGVVANNVLRAVSHVNPPLCNFFCYSLLAKDGLGMEECFM